MDSLEMQNSISYAIQRTNTGGLAADEFPLDLFQGFSLGLPDAGFDEDETENARPGVDPERPGRAPC